MGWVRDHFDRERILDVGIPRMWSDLRDSLRLAAEEFRTCGNRPGVEITITETGPNGIYIIVRDNLSAEQTLELALSVRARAISVIPSYPRTRLRLEFVPGADGEAALAMDGKPITVEQACRLLLEPMFFQSQS